MNKDAQNKEEIKEMDACEATLWFRECRTLEEVESQYVQHMNAARWDVLDLSDVRSVKNEYSALKKILTTKGKA